MAGSSATVSKGKIVMEPEEPQKKARFTDKYFKFEFKYNQGNDISFAIITDFDWQQCFDDIVIMDHVRFVEWMEELQHLVVPATALGKPVLSVSRMDRNPITTSLDLADVKVIEDGYAFANCINLKTVTARHVESIPVCTFSCCMGLETVFARKVKEVNTDAFWGTGEPDATLLCEKPDEVRMGKGHTGRIESIDVPIPDKVLL